MLKFLNGKYVTLLIEKDKPSAINSTCKEMNSKWISEKGMFYFKSFKSENAGNKEKSTDQSRN